MDFKNMEMNLYQEKAQRAAAPEKELLCQAAAVAEEKERQRERKSRRKEKERKDVWVRHGCCRGQTLVRMRSRLKRTK